MQFYITFEEQWHMIDEHFLLISVVWTVAVIDKQIKGFKKAIFLMQWQLDFILRLEQARTGCQ